MSGRRHTHPLYYLVGVIGVVFTVSACAYGVISFRAERGGDMYGRQAESGLIWLMREHGATVLGVEVVALAIVSVAAMAIDARSSKTLEAGASREYESGGETGVLPPHGP